MLRGAKTNEAAYEQEKSSGIYQRPVCLGENRMDDRIGLHRWANHLLDWKSALKIYSQEWCFYSKRHSLL